MAGHYPGLVPYHVFSDEGEELLLLPCRAGLGWSFSCVPLHLHRPLHPFPRFLSTRNQPALVR